MVLTFQDLYDMHKNLQQDILEDDLLNLEYQDDDEQCRHDHVQSYQPGTYPSGSYIRYQYMLVNMEVYLDHPSVQYMLW